MKKYKLINGTYAFYRKGEIYLEGFQAYNADFSVGELVKKYPSHWELVEDDFVLPEKWCIKSNDNLVVDYVNENGVNKGKYTKNECKIFYSHFPSYNNRITTSAEIKPGYREISLNQFKKYVLNMKEEKEIIGYLPKKDKIDLAEKAVILAFGSGWLEESGLPNIKEKGYMFIPAANKESLCFKLKQAGVLDLWFEPVYKETVPQITINGYKGEFFDWGVKFGCAEIHKKIFIEFNKLNLQIKDGDDPIGAKTNKEIKFVTIGKGTFSKKQIKEIAEYYLNKDK